MFSSRLYPLFVRAVSFQTCDMTFEQLKSISEVRPFWQLCLCLEVLREMIFISSSCVICMEYFA
ncbi:hypothetical protein C7R94_02705 [Brevibacillus sp. NRRL NRS-603]|nr:hypothetical protein C7R91_11425 [Brevibacillus formosus]PSK21000.1 hypothetical protein C7R94_02705 [Brevibacillus sp. NRRL NRS-603]